MLEYMLEVFSYLPVSSFQLKAAMKTYINEQLTWCNDSKFTLQFPYKETGLQQSFFQQKIISCDDGEYLTGPRYIGGDIQKPFIELVAGSAPLTRRATRSIYAEWQPMGASSIRMLRPHDSTMCGRIDQYIYTGIRSEINTFSDCVGERVSLQQADVSMTGWCTQAIQEAYDDSYLKLPYLKQRVFPADEEEIHEAIKEAKLFIIYSGTSRVGVIICDQGQRGFISGYWITEEIILPEYKGKHLASRAQRLLYSVLPKHYSYKALWGTIVSGNTPSIRAAELAGRKCVMEYVFLKEGDIHD
ncbi:GNAT family N-acetyltransferase [Rahnella sp. PAMC 25559]|uniref:GNAT family N-acetyltransferase n=1 Tax=Rahnella sp. PAMC 25559 TaxID=3423225 RepID=UPI003D674B80